MSGIQLAINVDDVEATTKCRAKLFDVDPAKTRHLLQRPLCHDTTTTEPAAATAASCC